MENNLCSDLFQKTVQNASEKNWMEKSPFRMEKSAFIFLKRFSVACSYFAKKNGENAFQKKWMDISPFWMEISPFWMEKSFWKTICREFSKKKLKTLLKNLNGEISIQNGEISIHFFWEAFCISFFKKRSVFYFKSSWKTLFFFLNGDDFSIFFLAWQIGNKQKKHKLFILLHSEWRNLHSEWRFLHSFFFRSVLNIFLKKISTENFLHLKWRNLHSEWRFLHSNVFQKRLEVFLKKISTENFLHLEN